MSKYVEDIYEDYLKKYKEVLIKGFHEGTIRLYDEELIKKLRYIYDCGVPASILLLCYELCVGQCHERAHLLSRAFLDTDDEVYVITADVDSLSLRPEIIRDDSDPLKSEHSFVYRKTKDGKEYIYDTTRGYIYDYNIYWDLERPKIRKILGKKSIRDRQEALVRKYPKMDKLNYILSAVYIDALKDQYKIPYETYSCEEGGPLQYELELLKERIGYEELKVTKKDNIEKVKKLLFTKNKKED